MSTIHRYVQAEKLLRMDEQSGGQLVRDKFACIIEFVKIQEVRQAEAGKALVRAGYVGRNLPTERECGDERSQNGESLPY